MILPIFPLDFSEIWWARQTLGRIIFQFFRQTCLTSSNRSQNNVEYNYHTPCILLEKQFKHPKKSANPWLVRIFDRILNERLGAQEPQLQSDSQQTCGVCRCIRNRFDDNSCFAVFCSHGLANISRCNGKLDSSGFGCGMCHAGYHLVYCLALLSPRTTISYGTI